MNSPEPSPLELVVVTANTTRTLPLPYRGSVSIGRGEQNDICLPDPSVSRTHALLHLESPLRIEDVGSANGLRVAAHRRSDAGTAKLVERRVLPGGAAEITFNDLILLGKTALHVQPASRNGQPVSRNDQPASRNDADSPPSSRVIRSLAAPVVRDSVMMELYETAGLVARSALNILLLGETGVGKEVMAEAIHQRSPRARGPLMGLNCAALSESLLESELFGHEAGAFTGAGKAKQGLFEVAEGGTIFLDEAGELPKSTQVKLLRVLEERKVLRVGGVVKRPIDVRFISATNQDLRAAVRQGAFREDLYFRLNGISLTIPPLRERTSEIEPLARSFMSRMAHQMKLHAEPSLSDKALEALGSYPWPGNIRELRNVIERAVVLSGGRTIQPAHLGLSMKPSSVPPVRSVSPEAITIPPHTVPPITPPPSTFAPSTPPPSTTRSTTSPPITPLRTKSGEIERQRILEALEHCGGNQTQAAGLLGISRRTLLSRLDLYGITRPRKKE